MIELLFRLRNAISPVTALIIPGYVQLRSMSAHFARPKDKHDGIHEAVLRVLERERQGPDDFKGQGLPKAYCAAVGAHDEVELHRPKAARAGVVQRVLTHASSHPSTGGGPAGHVTTIADMFAATGLVRADIVCAK